MIPAPTARQPSASPGVVLLLLVLSAFPSDLAAQDLAIKRQVPQGESQRCSVGLLQLPAPASEDAAEARRLAGLASQAGILGDLEEARELLVRASGLDPTDARVAYLLGRNLEETGDGPGAARQYCRYLELDPQAADAVEVRAAIERLAAPAAPAVPERAVLAFEQGISSWDDLRMADAEAAFTAALREAPTWAAPWFNRGVARRGQGRSAEAAEDFVRYLELESAAADVRDVLGVILAMREPPPRGPSAGVAFFAGLIPGVGHFYTGRPVLGTVVLATAAGAAATGLLMKERTVECLSRPSNGDVCPSGQVADESVERPYLLPGLGVAAAVTLIGAIHAARGAAGSVDFDAGDGRVAATLQILPLDFETRGGDVRLSWLRLRF